MISINLLPDVKKELLRIRRERNLVVSISILAVGGSIAALVILGGILGGLNIAKVVMESGINKNKATINSAIDDKQLNEYLTIQNQLAQIDGLKDQQLVYSRIMDYLVELNPASPNNVELRTVDLDASADGGVTMTVEGNVRDFSALNVYKNTLQSAQLVYEESADDDQSDSADPNAGTGNNDQTSSSTTADSDNVNVNDSTTIDDATASKETLFTSVAVTDQSLSSSGGSASVRFTIVAEFSANAFSQTIDGDSIKIEIPKETTSDGDRNAPKTEDDEDASGEESTSGEGASGDGDDQRQTFNATETGETTNTSTGEGY